MHQITLCIQSPDLKSRLRAAALLMQANLRELALDALVQCGPSAGHWVLVDHSLEDLAKLIASFKSSNLKPEHHIIRFIDKPWQAYVYHDVPIFASMVVPPDPLSATQILERLMRTQPLSFEPTPACKPHAHNPFGEAFCKSPPMQQAVLQLNKLKHLPVDTVLLGPTGAGKDTAARWLHEHSGLKGQFVHVNCAALPEQLFEAELFGAEAGAYTGAQKSRVGKLELAHEGTLYLDEIDSLSLACQAKLLTALQYRGAARLGGNSFYTVNVRVIASTKASFKSLVEQGRFREDLHYRLSVTQLNLPCLHERLEDIIPLYRYFMQHASSTFKLPLPQLSQEDCDVLLSFPWPGNVRELQAVAQRHVMGLQTPGLGLGDLGEPARLGLTLPQRVMAFERAVIHQTLANCKGCAKTASTLLGIPLHSLYYRLKRSEQEVKLNQTSQITTQIKDI
ncbi:sigma 54-interacting transcriptional regulator [Limnobacter sp.]|uniref:sigma 54-interacting transcriptional regulator n=1 Tax=Limnobacter sp. TaxID=2003368 RepID=UPI00351703D1